MTIASFIADLGVDPAGVRAGLDKAAGYVRQFSKTMDSEVTASLDRSNRSVSSLTTKFYALATAIATGLAIRAGINFNRTMETAELGIASLITAQARLTDANGNVLTGTTALGAAQGIAAVQMRALRIAGIQTVATTQELVTAFQQAVGVGLRWGLTLDQIRKITIGIVQAAGALGVPMNQLNEEVRDLLAGNINARNTRVATALGITNEDIRNARETGKLAEFVLGKLKAFNVAGAATAQTWAGVTSNIREAFELFMGDALKPAFDSLKVAMNTALSDVFNLDTATISSSFAGIVSVAQRIFGGVGDLLAKAIAGGVALAKDFNRWLVANRGEVDGILTSFGLLVAAAASLVGDVLKLIPALGAAGTESGFFRTILVGAALAAAEIHTAFQGLTMLFGALGILILHAIIKPLEWLNTLASKFIGIINPNSVAGSFIEGLFGKGTLDKAKAFFAEAGTAGDGFLKETRTGWMAYVDEIAEGGNATDQFLAKLAEVDKLTTKIASKKPGTGVGASVGNPAAKDIFSPVDDDGLKDLEQMTAKLLKLHSIATKAGDFAALAAIGPKVANAMAEASRLFGNETDKLSDNAVRLRVVLDQLGDAFTDAGLSLPNVSALKLKLTAELMPARTSLLRNAGDRLLTEQEQRSGRIGADTGARLGTVGLNGVRGMPGFTLPIPKAAPLPAPTQSDAWTRYHAIMQQVTDGLGRFGSGLWNVVRSGGMAIISNVLSQLSPFGMIVNALSDAMKPLTPVLTLIGKIIADTLAPIFETLAPIIRAFIPFFRAMLQIIAPLVQALLPILEAIVPILEALFPLFKFAAIVLTYFIQAAALASSIILRFVGNIIIVIGEIFKALAKAIDALPGVSAKHAIAVADGIIDFGKGMLHAADDFKKTADDMSKARDKINGVDIDHTTDSIDDLGDAASKAAAQLLNVPTWFKINLARFRSALPVGNTPPVGEPRRRFPTTGTPPGTTGTPPGGTEPTGLTITGDVYVDARSMSPSEIFDAIMREGNNRARAQGVGTWSEVT